MSPLRRRAKRHAPEDKAYAALRAELIPGRCEVCEPLNVALIAAGRPPVVCEGVAWELNHRRKRSSSGALANRANVDISCHSGNMALEDWPIEGHAAGLVVRSCCDDWEALGSRVWRERSEG